MEITTDNASNNLTFIDTLSKENGSFQKENHFRCFAHVINLCVQDALEELNNQFLSQVRIILFIIINKIVKYIILLNKYFISYSFEHF